MVRTKAECEWCAKKFISETRDMRIFRFCSPKCEGNFKRSDLGFKNLPIRSDYTPSQETQNEVKKT